MKKLHYKIAKILMLLTATTSAFIGFGFFMTSCSSKKIQFANFESYMSPKLQQRLSDEYDIQFSFYNTSEDIKKKFERYYDIAIPSSYTTVEMIRDNLLGFIDWKYFNLDFVETLDSEGNLIIKDINANNKVDDAYEALSLFTSVPGLVDLLTQTYDLNNNGKIGDLEDNLLLYGIPYFLQDFIFAYKGNEISELAGITWDKLAYTISPSNPNLDNRFKPNGNTPNLGMIDDAFSFYDICRIAQTTSQDPTNVSMIPQGDSEQVFTQTYDTFTNNYSGHRDSWYYLNTDSGWMSRSLADPTGLNGLIAYNGDILYAAKGAGEFDNLNSSNLHVVKPKDTLICLDLLVINKNVNDSPEKKSVVYDVLYDVALEGYNSKNIYEKNAQGDFAFGPMLNFDSVWYTPVLNPVYDFVMDDSKETMSYWEVDNSDDLKFYQSILNITLNSKFIDQPLSDLQKSNMHWAYIKAREKLAL